MQFTPEQTAIARRKMRSYAWYKLLGAAVRAHRKFERDQVRGAWAALRRIDVALGGAPRREGWLYRRGEVLERAGRPVGARARRRPGAAQAPGALFE